MEEDWMHSFKPNTFLDTYRREADLKERLETSTTSRETFEKIKKKCKINFIFPGQFKTPWPFHLLPGILNKLKQSKPSIFEPCIAL